MRSTPLKFKDFELDPVSYQLLCKGSPVKLERIPMELLLFLASRPGELVTRTEIIEKLWGKDAFLDTENGINTAIRKVRLALQDDPEEPRFVLTIAGRGYRFIAPINDQNGKDWSSPKEEASSQIDVSAPDKSRGRLRKWALWLGTAVIALAAIVFAARLITRTTKPAQPMRISAEIGADASLYTEYGPAAILSPDGTRLAFVATGSDQRRRIYVRSLDQLQAGVLAGTEGAYDHFFSPDGQWLGFFADGKLKKISAQGGAVVVLCDAFNSRGASWGEDGAIVFTPKRPGRPVESVFDRRNAASIDHAGFTTRRSYPALATGAARRERSSLHFQHRRCELRGF
jgi:DNA-binding winged helix-turn-helix (wHTH) protein